MTDLHKAAESLLAELGTYFDAYPHMQKGHVIDAITALREALAAPQPDSTAIHSCSYYCDRPDCIKAQRDELREALAKPAVPPGYVLVPVDALERWRAAFDEELSAWDIDPPLHHVQTSHDEIGAFLEAAHNAPKVTNA